MEMGGLIDKKAEQQHKRNEMARIRRDYEKIRAKAAENEAEKLREAEAKIPDDLISKEALYFAITELLKAQPVIDAVPMKALHCDDREQGEWLGKGNKTKCSVCGKPPLEKMSCYTSYFELRKYKPPFCPNCGAKMRVEDDA